MLRLAILMAWLGSANLENTAQQLTSAMTTAVCGDPGSLPPAHLPVHRRHGSDCSGACHAARRRDAAQRETCD